MEKIIKRIKAQFDPYYEISIERYRAVIPYLKLEEYIPKQVVKKRSMVEIKARYLLKGSMGLFVYTDKGPKCQEYFRPDQIACDFISYVSEKLTDKLLKTYEATEAVVFYKKDYHALIEKVPEFATLALKITEQEYQKKILWGEQIKGKSVRERVIIFLRMDPQALDLLPYRDAAHILNMSPEALSRVLKEMDTDMLD